MRQEFWNASRSITGLQGFAQTTGDTISGSDEDYNWSLMQIMEE